MAHAREFILFLASGGIAAALNWGSRFFFSFWLPFEVAVVLAFCVGLLSGFVLMRSLAFAAGDRPALPQLGRYLLVNAAALVQTLLISVVLARWALPAIGAREHAEAVGHLVGVLFPVLTSYVMHRAFTFR